MLTLHFKTNKTKFALAVSPLTHTFPSGTHGGPTIIFQQARTGKIFFTVSEKKWSLQYFVKIVFLPKLKIKKSLINFCDKMKCVRKKMRILPLPAGKKVWDHRGSHWGKCGQVGKQLGQKFFGLFEM